MGGSDGLDVLRTTKALHPTCSVILMTAFGTVNTAVEAMKIGAFDYVQKPFEIEEMEVKIEKALELKRLRHELDYLRNEQQETYDFEKIVGNSEALQRVLGVVKKVAKSNSTVLIHGETGTGKELIAGAIHHNSRRAARTSSRSTARRCRRTCSNPSCSATRRARSPAPTRSASAASSRPTAARCSSTKSAT